MPYIRGCARRRRVKELESRLEASAGLYRSVEKRLLVRFKDKNPQPLNKVQWRLFSLRFPGPPPPAAATGARPKPNP